MSENFGSEYKEYFGGEIHDNYNSEGKMSEPSFLFFTFSWNNIPSTSLPNTKKQGIDAIRNEIGLIEGLFLTVFGIGNGLFRCPSNSVHEVLHLEEEFVECEKERLSDSHVVFHLSEIRGRKRKQKDGRIHCDSSSMQTRTGVFSQID